MKFWASAIVRCAGWNRDCTPTYTASFTIPKTRKPFFAAAAVGLCGARVSFSPRVRSEDSVVAGNGARRIRFGPLSLSVCVWELRDTMANWRPGEGEERVLQFQTVFEAVHYRCLLRLKIFWNHPRSTKVMSTSTYILREPINEEIEMFRE